MSGRKKVRHFLCGIADIQSIANLCGARYLEIQWMNIQDWGPVVGLPKQLGLAKLVCWAYCWDHKALDEHGWIDERKRALKYLVTERQGRFPSQACSRMDDYAANDAAWTMYAGQVFVLHMAARNGPLPSIRAMKGSKLFPVAAFASIVQDIVSLPQMVIFQASEPR